VKSEGFDDLLHVVKPGGLVCFSIREMALNATKYGYREKMAQFGEEGKWKLLSKHHKSVYLNDDSAWCFVYQKL
jgi:hypothetical protein